MKIFVDKEDLIRKINISVRDAFDQGLKQFCAIVHFELRRHVDETDNITFGIDYTGTWSIVLTALSGSIHYTTRQADLIAAVNSAIYYIKTNRIITTPSDKKYYLR